MGMQGVWVFFHGGEMTVQELIDELQALSDRGYDALPVYAERRQDYGSEPFVISNIGYCIGMLRFPATRPWPTRGGNRVVLTLGARDA